MSAEIPSHELDMRTYTIEDFRRWGSKGGAKSRRKLTKKQARAMVKAREAKWKQNER
jgi:hypothetical protein